MFTKYSQPWALALILLLLVGATGRVGAQETPPETPPAKENVPETSLQVINATSIPELELSRDGKVMYPSFPQGLYTAGGTTPVLKPSYTVRDPVSKQEVKFNPEFEANKHQSMIILGDFSVPEDPGLYLIDPAAKKTESPVGKPNVLFLVFDFDLPKEVKPFRFRILNGMPGVPLEIDLGGSEGKVTVAPGHNYELQGQPAVTTIPVTVKQKLIPVFINQQGILRNCTIVFYLKKGEPTFMRGFETTGKTYREIQEKEAAEGG